MTKAELDHALAVAAAVPPRLRRLAFLHDSIEDGWLGTIGGADLLSDAQWHALQLLTRRGESYEKYIENLQAAEGYVGEIARTVKVADLTHNLSRLDASHESLRPRYERALEVLS